MDDLSRSEYPAMLYNLQPGQAVQVLQDRVRRIGKINQDIADWLQERRRIEEQYVNGLRRLVHFKVPANSAELGVFQPTWDGLLRSVDSMASSHHQFSQRVEADIETPLRNFQLKREVTNMNTIANNLQGMARELEDAQDKADKMGRKAGKASAQKVEAATQRLDAANQQWESQAPFIFETLQALDEQRVNHLRDVLTQLETHEVEQTVRTQSAAEVILNLILEVQTADEIQTFAQRTVEGRPRIERRSTARQPSIAGSVQSSNAPLPPLPAQPAAAPAAASTAAPAVATAPAQTLAPTPAAAPLRPISRGNSAQESSSSRHEPPSPHESKLRSRIGTMLGRRRQSTHGGFGPLSPSKNSGPFSRVSGGGSSSSQGRSISPRASSQNLPEGGNNRLSSLAESPDSPVPPRTAEARPHLSRDGATNGVSGSEAARGASGPSSGGVAGVGVVDASTLNYMTADEIFGMPPPPGPPPSQQQNAAPAEPARDADGYSVPAASNDPISQAQREAAAAAGGNVGEDGEHAFKLNIKNEPLQEEDPQAKQAALSNVVNTLSMGMPTRKTGTVRGRRDVRSTIFAPAPPVAESSTATAASVTTATTAPTPVSRSSTFASSSATTPTRPSAVAALASEGSVAGTSDTQSVRSATSLSSLAHLKHIDSASPGLNTSIIETVSASFEDGGLKATHLAGEIAFSYNPTAESPGGTETIRIDNFALLESLGPNRIFVQHTSAPDEFTLDTNHLQHKATVGFTFRAHDDQAAALAAHCPLVIKPIWKPTGDKLGLLLQYRLNPEAKSFVSAAAGQPATVVLRNVVFIASYEGARASGVQTKPSGTHLKDKHIVYWRMSELTLTDVWSKIVCRIIGEQGAEPQPGHIDARWEYVVPAGAPSGHGTGITISRRTAGASAPVEEDNADPFADEAVTSPPTANGNGVAAWAEVPAVRQIVSGKYEAK